MKIRTGYGLKEKLSDGRKLTLQLDWHYLTTSEIKGIKSLVEQVLQALLGEQKILYMGTLDGGRRLRFHATIPWKAQTNVNMQVKGFVRTEESVFAQSRRIKHSLKEKRRYSRLRVSPYFENPYIDVTKEQGIALVNKYVTAPQRAHSVQGGVPEEVTVTFRQKYCDDGSYDISISISISGYAIGYALQDLVQEYKKQLLVVSEKTPLFAGYIFYENTPKGEYAYFHRCPEKFNGRPARMFHLTGYEWAAYINRELAKELSKEQMEQLQQLADVSFLKNGIFYQMRCDILQYTAEEKKRCREILDALLQPGYGYVSISDLFADQMPIPQTKVYLLQPKYCGNGQFSVLGFYNKTTPEEAETGRFYKVIEAIEIP